jgi:hypothetical protein
MLSIDQPPFDAPEAPITELDAPGSVVLSPGAAEQEVGCSQPSRDENASNSEFRNLVDRDKRVFSSEPLPDSAHVSFNGQGGKFSAQGAVARLGVTLCAMVGVLGVVVVNGKPTSDAYFPMVLIGSVALGGTYLEENKK